MRRAQEFTDFVGARYAALLRSAILLTGNRHTAEDLVQEALLRTYSAWHRVEVIGAAEAYTRTTMVRLLIKDRRRRWSGEIPTAELPDRPGGWIDERTALVVTVRDALRQLPMDQRLVLVLRYLEDLSEAEVARVLGCRVGTVKSRTSRAIAKLRELQLLAPDPADARPASSTAATQHSTTAATQHPHTAATTTPPAPAGRSRAGAERASLERLVGAVHPDATAAGWG